MTCESPLPCLTVFRNHLGLFWDWTKQYCLFSPTHFPKSPSGCCAMMTEWQEKFVHDPGPSSSVISQTCGRVTPQKQLCWRAQMTSRCYDLHPHVVWLLALHILGHFPTRDASFSWLWKPLSPSFLSASLAASLQSLLVPSHFHTLKHWPLAQTPLSFCAKS